MEVYDLSEENGLDTYMSMEVPVSEGDEAKEDIMLMLQRMMNHPERDPDMKVKILQAKTNMFWYQLSQVTLLMEVMIGSSIVGLPRIW